MKTTYKPGMCPHCGADQDLHTGLGQKSTPHDGDFALCMKCAQFSVYTGEGFRRKPNVFEDALIRTSPQCQRAIAALEAAVKKNPEREAPIEDEYRELMNGVAHFLGGAFEGSGFALLVFEFNEPSRVNFISNAERETMIAAMKEFIARHEGRAHEASDSKH